VFLELWRQRQTFSSAPVSAAVTYASFCWCLRCYDNSGDDADAFIGRYSRFGGTLYLHLQVVDVRKSIVYTGLREGLS
jgi:hypothetical protein